jgi:hypothetical protein
VKKSPKMLWTKSHWFCQWSITTRGFPNFPSILPCYKNIFYMPLVPLLPLSSFLIISHHLCIYHKNQAPLDQISWTRLLWWWGGGPKTKARTKEWTSGVGLVGNPHKRLWWGWPSHHHYLMKIFMVYLVHQLSLGENMVKYTQKIMN